MASDRFTVGGSNEGPQQGDVCCSTAVAPLFWRVPVLKEEASLGISIEAKLNIDGALDETAVNELETWMAYVVAKLRRRVSPVSPSTARVEKVRAALKSGKLKVSKSTSPRKAGR